MAVDTHRPLIKIRLAEAVSHDQTRDALYQALRGKYPQKYYWVRDIYDDRFIVEENDENGFCRLYSIGYSMAEDGAVTLDDMMAPVRMMVDYLPIAESVQVREAAGGNVWRVLMIQPGTSHNGYHYSEQLLREAVAAGKFEGVRALVRSDEDHLAGRAASAENLVGWYSNITYAEGMGVIGDFTCTDEDLGSKLQAGYDHGKLDYVQFSIVGGGHGRRAQMDGRLVTIVESLEKIEYVDAVLNASAGGRVLSLVEAQIRDDTMNLEALLKFLQKHHPTAYAQLDLENITPDAVFAVMEHLDIADPTSAHPVSDPAPGLSNDPSEGDGEGDGAAMEQVAVAEARLTRTLQQLQAQERRVLVQASRLQLREALQGSGLPQRVQQHIARPFHARLDAGQALTELEITEAIQEQRSLLGDLHQSGHITGFGAEVASSLRISEAVEDKTIQAFHDFFARKPGAPASIRRLYTDLTGDVNVTGRLSDMPGLRRYQRLAEAQLRLGESVTTTVFDQVFQDALNVQLVREYGNFQTSDSGGRTPLNSWMAWVDVVPVSDFRTQHRVRYGGYGNLPTITAGNPYLPLTSPTDEEATYTPAIRGGTELIHRQAIMNDNVSFILGIPRRMAMAAAQTLHEFVWDFLDSNAAIYDAVALFHANHNNLNTTAFGTDDAQYMIVRQKMRAQTDMSSGKPIVPMPAHLAVPNELESAARNAFIRDTNNDPRLSQVQAPMIHVIDYWSDANNWYVLADKMFTPMLELGFVNGQQEPEMFRQDNPDVGSVFTHDAVTLKIRHEYGGAIIDFRGLQGAIVA